MPRSVIERGSAHGPGIRAGARTIADEDCELVREAWAACSRGDIPAFLRFCTECVELVPLGADLQKTVYRGHDGVLDWWENEMVPNWQSYEEIPQQFQRVGECLLVFGCFRARGRASGVELDIPATWVIQVRAGKIAGWHTYTERNEALEAVGLAAQNVHGAKASRAASATSTPRVNWRTGRAGPDRRVQRPRQLGSDSRPASAVA